MVVVFFFQNAGRKSFLFSLTIHIDIHFVWVVQDQCILVLGIKLHLIPVYDEIDLVVMGGLIWLGF